ncbi:MAG: nucleotide pyrophosphohydrolase [Verrucomicrobiota bacterium]
MDDRSTSLSVIKEKVLAFARERDWEQFHSPKNLAMAIAAESGELLEHFLWMDSDKSREAGTDPDKIAKVREELSDIIIYCIEFANMTGTDLSASIDAKIK